MARGGARARSGPAAKLDALARERDKGDWIYLPEKSGRRKAPDWPLTKTATVVYGKGEDAISEDIHHLEIRHWERLWRKGQSLMWEIDGQEVQVALYVRALTRAEVTMDITSSGMLAEIRRQEEGLGLNTAGLARNKWRFERFKDHTVEAAEHAEDAGQRKADNVVDLWDGLQREA